MSTVYPLSDMSPRQRPNRLSSSWTISTDATDLESRTEALNANDNSQRQSRRPTSVRSHDSNSVQGSNISVTEGQGESETTVSRKDRGQFKSRHIQMMGIGRESLNSCY